MPNLAQEAKSEMIVAVTGRERHTIFSIYAQRLLMGPKYNSATSLEELGSNKIYRRSKCASKMVEVPNLAQAAKLELFVDVKERKRHTIPTLHSQRLHLGSI